MSFSPDGTKLVTGSYDNLAMIWDVGANIGAKLGEPLKGHTDGITCLSYSP